MKKITIALLACTLLLCGCTESHIVSSGGANSGPDMGVKQGIEIDWNQVWNDLDAQFANPDEYPISESVNCSVIEEENRIEFYLLVQPGTTAEEAIPYATAVLKGFNDSIATQDFSYEASGDDSYGGYLSKFDIYVLISPYDSKEFSDTWILEDTIKAGEAYREVRVQAAAD